MAKRPPPERDTSPPPISDLWALLAANLRVARKAAGLSQAELARRTGISRTLIRAIEAAEQNVTLETVERIANAVGHRASELLCQRL